MTPKKALVLISQILNSNLAFKINVSIMEVPKSLARPTSWQDFETLCEMLWGEIWNCDEIVKNGRNGNNQNGVDIYGIPEGKNEFYGIQCKGKDEYTNSQLTEKEITIEIEKAKTFYPPLKKLYFTTTATRNPKVQEFVRTKNLENISIGLFEVHVFFWDDIVNKILTNKRTYDYYVKSINFTTNRSVFVTFENGRTEIIKSPKFARIYDSRAQKITLTQNPFNKVPMPDLSYLDDFLKNFDTINEMSYTKEINESYFSFNLLIQNTGTEPLEDYKLKFDFEGNVSNISLTNSRSLKPELIFIKPNPDIFIKSDSNTVEIIPHKSLVGSDSYKSKEVFLKSPHTESKIVLNWKLFSKHFQDKGHLYINLNPTIERRFVDLSKEDVVHDAEGISDFLIKIK